MELAKRGGDNPTIVTADGRTLRLVCPGYKHGPDYCVQEFGYTIEAGGSYFEDITIASCQGRGWVPVSSDTAVVVKLEWLIQQTWGTTSLRKVRIESVVLDTIRITLEGKPLPAAVFAAAKRVAGEVSDE